MPTSPAVSALSRDDGDGDIEMRSLDNHAPPDYLAVPREPSPSPADSRQPLTSAASPAYTPRSRGPQVTNPRPLRRHRMWCWLFTIYLPIIVVPWVLTVILNYRPILLSSYTDPSPNPQSSFDYDDRVLTAIRILNSVAALLTVPVLSFMLAVGAVIYTQRRKKTQHLSLQQTFALADRGWGDLRTIFNSLRSNHHKGSAYLYWGFALIFIGSLHQPLRELLVSQVTVNVSTCTDDNVFGSICDDFDPPATAVTVGVSPQLSDVLQVPRTTVVDALSSDLITGSTDDLQPLLWNRNIRIPQRLASYIGPENDTVSSSYAPPENWIATVPNGTTTGVIQQYTLRINSSTTCAPMDIFDFPSTCSGPSPFFTTYNSNNTQVNNTRDSFETQPPFTVSICVPGNTTGTPWTSDRNRQDITEDLYLKTVGFNATSSSDASLEQPFTFGLHCTTHTTLGSFTLGSNNNSSTPSPIRTFPAGTSSTPSPFSDTAPIPEEFTFPDYTSGLPLHTVAPGPLTSLALSLFGPTSFFAAAQNSTNGTTTAQALCTTPTIPLGGIYPFAESGLDPCPSVSDDGPVVDDDDLNKLIWQWLQPFAQNDVANTVFGTGVWYAGKQILLQAGRDSDFLTTDFLTGSGILSVPGYATIKPSVSLAGVVVVSVLLGTQVLGMFVLAIWNVREGSWTESLDALAVGRLAVSVPRYRDELGERRGDGAGAGEREGEGDVWPPIADVQGIRAQLGEKYWKPLDRVDGVVGREVRESEGEVERGYFGKQVPSLVRGGRGIVRADERLRKQGLGSKA